MVACCTNTLNKRRPTLRTWMFLSSKAFPYCQRTTSPLSPHPSIIPASSKLKRFSGSIKAIAGQSIFCHQDRIVGVVAPLTSAESILNCFLVWRIGLCLKHPFIQHFPRVFDSPRSSNTRSARLLILRMRGGWPRPSWSTIQSGRRCS